MRGVMSDQFIGELRCFGFNFAPKGWALCDGQILSVQQNAALFSLLGTAYGGNGTTTFQLPNLQSRVPVHQGTDRSGTPYVNGEFGGQENVTLLVTEIPAHTHSIAATTNTAVLKRPISGTRYAASSSGNTFYATPGSLTAIAPSTVSATGGNQAHTNIQPYLTLTWCIALSGIFPSRS
jgi:microcystin-dependent protein